MKKSVSELLEMIDNCGVRKGQHWRHYKGDVYEVKNIVVDCNTNEPVVVYWLEGVLHYIEFCRSLDEWNSTTEDGEPRFVQVRKREVFFTDEEFNNTVSGRIK